MFNKLIDLYTKGDIAQLSQSILHSTSWKQHDFTAYGNMQIEKLWLKSLEQFGFLTLSKKQVVQGKEFSAIMLYPKMFVKCLMGSIKRLRNGGIFGKRNTSRALREFIPLMPKLMSLVLVRAMVFLLCVSFSLNYIIV